MILKNNDGSYKIGYSYNDMTIVPAEISDVSHRSECNVFDGNGMLPIFTAPMSCVVNEANLKLWERNHINVIVPRTVNLAIRLTYMHYDNKWISMSQSEFDDVFIHWKYEKYPEAGHVYNVLIDIANGHMRSLYDLINKARESEVEGGYKLHIMVGNIANPETYKWICNHCEVDYVRLSIGSGSGCLTTSNTGTHYPIASLIDECYEFKKKIKLVDGKWKRYVGVTPSYMSEYPDDYEPDPYITYKSCPYLIADGGIRGYADVIKALALGADYVMIGGLFGGLLESAGDITEIEHYNSHYRSYYNSDLGRIYWGVDDFIDIWDEHTTEEKKKKFINDNKTITKEFFGMSTKKAQYLIWEANKLGDNEEQPEFKTSEGCTKYIKVTHTIKQWVDNLIDYIKSDMSYTNHTEFTEWIGSVNLIINSPYTIASVNK